MFKNYLKTAVRNLLKYKIYSVINILGLAVGFACCILILLYVIDEISYDRYHTKVDRIYRLVTERSAGGSVTQWAVSPSAHAPSLLNAFPEIQAAVRFYKTQPLLRHGEHHFAEKRFFFADSSVLDVFTFPLLQGNPQTALRQPFSVLLTEQMAKKYFGEENPMGKIITYENKYDFKVTGILKDPPANSHFHFDFLASFVSLREVLQYLLGERALNDWVASMHYTYLLLADGAVPSALEKRLPDYVKQYMDEDDAAVTRLLLQPLRNIHLRSHLNGEIEANGDVAYVYIFLAVAALVLFISCSNFMNLAIARSVNRTKEVGVRKVVGAARRQLIAQFLGEATLYSFIALLFALLLVELLLPLFNALSGKPLRFGYISNWPTVAGLGALALLVGLISGSYPALFVSRFHPVAVIKGMLKSGTGGFHLRKVLIVTQFTIAIGLIVGMAVVYKQLRFVKTKNLGFQKEQIIVMPLVPEIRNRYESVKQELLSNPRIVHASVSSVVPGRRPMTQTCTAEGLPDGETILMPTIVVDHDFLETFGLTLSAGRNFSRAIKGDESEAFILNEAAVKQLGWKSAIGKQFHVLVEPEYKGLIIGVVKNFHFRSLHQAIEPLVLRIQPFWYRNLSVRVGAEDISGTLDFLQSQWREFAPGRPFEYFFLDEDFDSQYQSEERIGRILSAFAFQAIFVACLGLFGLASYFARVRTKEVGIRKALGASMANLVLLLSKEFVNLVLLANLVAWPVAYFAMNRWLQDFAYRVEIGFGVFLLAGLLALMITLVTVSFHALKAALANPVEALRYE
jgi:putative ABC transport system permease protein